jgi:rod shape-determining protein MreC
MARAVRAGSRIDAALLVACALLSLLAIVLPTPTRDALAATFQRTLAAPLLAMQQRSERARSALAERERVSHRVDSLMLRATELGELEAENARLRELLALGPRLSHGFIPAEALHGQGIGDGHSVLLTVGARAGVVPRSAVVAPDGVVGLVTAVNPTTSHVMLWSNPDFRVSAMSADGETFGIVTPHLSDDDACVGAEQISCAGPERLLLELRGVAFRDALKPGTRIVSSGLGGVFPRGIVIGTVIGEVKQTEQWSRTYIVRPAVRPQDASAVMVIAPQRVADNLTPVWAEGLLADDVSRRVIAAGDSLTRQAAAAIAVAAAARQRSIDSLAAVRAAAQDSAARPPAPNAAARAPLTRPDTVRP